GQLKGWPASRSTKAAASRALSFLAGAAGPSPGSGVSLVADGRFFAAADEVAGTRFFFCGMESLLGRKLLAASGTPVAPLYQGRGTTSTVPPPPGNSTPNPEGFRGYDKLPHAALRSGAGRFGAAQLAPAPALLIPIEHRRHTQELA